MEGDGFYSVDKNNNEVVVDNKKLNNFESLLNKVVEMIKSGRADNIKEALNEIEKDRVNELQQNSLAEKNRQLSEMNEKLQYLNDIAYYENGGYLDDDYWNR